MKIQPILIQNKYSQPAFKADFDYKDEETRACLKSMAFTVSYPMNAKHVWSLMQDIKKLPQKDLLRIKYDEDKMEFTVTNTSTNDSIAIDMEPCKYKGNIYFCYYLKTPEWNTLGFDRHKSYFSYYRKIPGWNEERSPISTIWPPTNDEFNNKIARNIYQAIFSDYSMMKLFGIKKDIVLPPAYVTPTLPDYPNPEFEKEKKLKKAEYEHTIREIDEQISNIESSINLNDKGNCKSKTEELKKLREERYENECNLAQLILSEYYDRSQFVCTEIDKLA